jgi:hypothetical protein
MTYLTEFSDFDYALPVIEGFADASWHDDVCPSLINEALGLRLWCDYADTAKRELPGARRYILVHGGFDDIESETVLTETDDFADVLKAIAARWQTGLKNNLR